MCHFVTPYFPKNANVAAVQTLFDENKFGFKQIENTHVQKQLGEAVIQILTTRGICDCGTKLASIQPFVPNGSPSDRELIKLREKGWSESRIRRWLDEKAMATKRDQVAHEQHLIDTSAETNQWVRVIGQILYSGVADWIGVLVHEYRGGLTERVELQKANKIRLATMTEDTLLKMNEDTILIVQA